MRVYSADTGFFNNQFVMRSGIAILMLAVFFIFSSFTEHFGRDSRAKHVNLIIRKIGDRLLLQAGDSTSRVMPVTEIKEGTFLLKFEKKFVFNHDSLMLMSQNLLSKTQFPSGYSVTVHDCGKGDIVYGFQVNNTSPDILACSGRSQPPGCYTIEFAFPDFYVNAKQNKATIDQLTASTTVDPQEANPTLEKFKSSTFGAERTGETPTLKSVVVDSQKVRQKLGAFKPTTVDYPLGIAIFGGLLLLLGGTLLIVRSRKILKPAPLESHQHAISKEPVAAGDTLGKFLFDIKGQRLQWGTEVIGLTDKECKVLELLHKSFGKLIPRETLMQEVWINDGVITGRSLDMFISKLRKKLSVDPDLRITNIHGKGYRLETLHACVA